MRVYKIKARIVPQFASVFKSPRASGALALAPCNQRGLIFSHGTQFLRRIRLLGAQRFKARNPAQKSYQTLTSTSKFR
ncbi:MAG: hypothetical protein DCC52_18015 [Chloroflexi bacterium]|nr:MAG: hypothetical protein DCC52_18015 [Chloroflexota bacterium]